MFADAVLDACLTTGVTIQGKIPFELQGQLKEEQFKLNDGIDLDRYQIVCILINGYAFNVNNWYEAYDTGRGYH